ncbi:TPA: hypothetical protein VKO94_001438 [Streptococcus pyogenes NGAS260]|nr:hypothetical protein [Streptococcus pyogenes NGAS260]
MTCDIKGQEKTIKNTLTEMNLDAKSDNRLEDVRVIFIIFSFKMLYFRHVKKSCLLSKFKHDSRFFCFLS